MDEVGIGLDGARTWAKMARGVKLGLDSGAARHNHQKTLVSTQGNHSRSTGGSERLSCNRELERREGH